MPIHDPYEYENTSQHCRIIRNNEHTGHRRSIRLKDYDYAQNGLYFVTICLNEKSSLFGNITDDVMRFNDAGTMTHRWFIELENKFPDLQSDEFIFMPNHIHFIIANTGKPEYQQTVGANLCVRPHSTRSSCDSTQKGQSRHVGTAPTKEWKCSFTIIPK
jgi:hypothetical protein